MTRLEEEKRQKILSGASDCTAYFAEKDSYVKGALRSLRIAASLVPQKEIAEGLGISQQYLNGFVRGRRELTPVIVRRFSEWAKGRFGDDGRGWS